LIFHPVKSSNIHSIAYDPESQELLVKFRSSAGPGSTYAYSGVPPEVHRAFMSAPSHGIHFIDNIRGKYKERKL
jgi:hypothetical protein